MGDACLTPISAFPLSRSVSAVTFNTRSVLHSHGATRRSKVNFVMDLARVHDAFALQEGKAKPSLIRKQFAVLRATHHVFHSPCNTLEVDKQGRGSLRSRLLSRPNSTVG